MRFLFLALLIIAGILGAVLLMQKGQERIVAETTPQATTGAMPNAAPTLPTPATPAPMQPMPADAASSPTQSPDAAPTPNTPPAAGAPSSRIPATGTPPGRKPTEPAAPAFQVLAKPAVVAAGILETTRGRVTLKDIAPLDPITLCGTETSAWPCGQLALTQLRRFLRGRSVNCDIADPNWQDAVTARCMLGKEDVAAWLVENGWAKAGPGSPYEAAGRAAQADKRGIFGLDPRHP